MFAIQRSRHDGHAVASIHGFWCSDCMVVALMTKSLLVLVVVASVLAGIALDRAGWRHRKQLWQLQGGAIGLGVGYMLGRSRLL